MISTKPVSDMTISELSEEVRLLRQSASNRPAGQRCIFVVDRGWIFAGDVRVLEDGYIRLDRAVWVFRWESVGFAAVVADPVKSKADIRPIEPPEIPPNSILYRIPVSEDWGMKK